MTDNLEQQARELLAASGTMSDEVCDMMIAARTEADVDAAIDASMPAAGIAQ